MREIPLTNSPLVALVDDDDYPLLSRITWNLNDAGYANNFRCSMHRLIMGFPSRQVDHIDRNKLNNLKSNLRTTDQRGQNQNRGSWKNNKTGFKGVWKDRRDLSKPWVAYIGSSGRHLHLGYFYTAEEAAMAYDAAARRLYGDFASPNFTSPQPVSPSE